MIYKHLHLFIIKWSNIYDFTVRIVANRLFADEQKYKLA